ncbi:MAG TPA: LysM peptidoglycan-binding domain-containing protein, partial [Bacteroidia bacterium]|nr:LysM peptidoglycan-binding domain-containing protein [Bacteroidia bacterium]
TYFDVDTVGVKNNISFRQLSQTLNIPYDVIAFLNPVYKRNMIPGEGNRLYLPTEKISLYLANEEGLYASSGTELQPSSFAIADDVGYVQVKQHVKVRKGENLYSFAKRNYCSAKQVKKWNNLRSNYLKAGQKLVVYTTIKQKATPVETTTETAANDKTDSAKVNTAVKADSSANTETGAVTSESKTTQVNQTQSAASKCIIHLVQPGDTLWNIAKRYEGVTVELLKEVNNFTPQSTLKVGSKIKIPTVG